MQEGDTMELHRSARTPWANNAFGTLRFVPSRVVLVRGSTLLNSGRTAVLAPNSSLCHAHGATDDFRPVPSPSSSHLRL